MTSNRFFTPVSFALALAFWGAASLSAATVQANLSVDSTQSVRTLSDRMFGVNTQIWDSILTTPQTESLVKAAGIRTMRFPGGSLSDTYVWDQNKSYNTTTGVLNTWSWATSFSDFEGIAKSLNQNVYITVNYGSGTAQMAADWVKKANITDGDGFKYWEIGNECYGSWEYDTHASQWDPVTYATQAVAYIQAMKAVDPTIKIGVVVEAGEDTLDSKSPVHNVTNPVTGVQHHGWTPVVLTTMKNLGVLPDFVIYHRYPQAPGSESDSFLLSGQATDGTTWADDSASIRSMLNDYLGSDGPNVEMDVTENNSVYSNPGKQSTSLVNGLYLADSFGQLLQTDFKAFMWWALHNGIGTNNNNSSSLYGWRKYGDYGILAPADATVTTPDDPYPTYYVMKLLSRFARGGDTIVKATTDNPLLTIYAAKRTDGTLSLLVINKSPTATENANISLTGFTPVSNAPMFTYGMAEDNAAKNGTPYTDSMVSRIDNVGTTFTASFTPYSVNVIKLYPSSSSSQIVNMSVRAECGTGAQQLILGFVLSGASGSTPVLVRALGPTLAKYNVANPLADPQLVLHKQPDSSGYPGADLDTNDNWGGSQSMIDLFSRLGASALDANSLDAALTATLAPHPYTALITGKNNGTGIALAEVYDASNAPDPSMAHLVNVSARGDVQGGAQVLIAGFVVNGNGPTTLLIRAVGPGLVSEGVTAGTELAEPKLDLHTTYNGKDTILATDTGWNNDATLNDAATTVGAPQFATDSKDSAILVTLPPGVYTAVVSGANGSTGIGLVEVFEMP